MGRRWSLPMNDVVEINSGRRREGEKYPRMAALVGGRHQRFRRRGYPALPRFKGITRSKTYLVIYLRLRYHGYILS